MELVDSFGRKTIFEGELLVEENTDTGQKPQWLEMKVWRTLGGSYIVLRITRYRVFHTSANCSRAVGYTLVEAGDEDNVNCPVCAKDASPYDEGFAQDSRVAVDAHPTPQELIESFRQEDGRYSNLARAVLATISAKDPDVDARWNTVVVP